MADVSINVSTRSQANVDAWLAANPEAKEQIKFFVVPDMTTAGAFDEAVKGVDVFAHVASPFIIESKDLRKDLLDPALDVSLLLSVSADRRIDVSCFSMA